jgi:hypothetical protein
MTDYKLSASLQGHEDDVRPLLYNFAPLLARHRCRSFIQNPSACFEILC